jgi:FtsH-binding integral membrane protein
MKKRRIPKKLIAIVAGLAAELLYITAPIHEFGHFIAAGLMGYYAEIHWRSTVLFGRPSWNEKLFFSWAGVGFETLFFLALGVICHKLSKPVASTLFFTISLSAFITAGWLTDVSRIGYEGILEWYFIGTAVFALIAYKSYLSKHKRKRASILATNM